MPLPCAQVVAEASPSEIAAASSSFVGFVSLRSFFTVPFEPTGMNWWGGFRGIREITRLYPQLSSNLQYSIEDTALPGENWISSDVVVYLRRP